MDARTKWQSLNLNDYEGDEWGPDAVAGIAGDYIAELEEENMAMLARCEEEPPKDLLDLAWVSAPERYGRRVWRMAMKRVKGER